VITDTNDVWADQFARSGERYDRTKLVVYSGGVQTGCGAATSDAGPFYCPADSLVYLDLSFWNELSGRLGASGDFAQAYVIAHEVGHHVQNQLGISDQVARLEQQHPDEAEGADGLSVRTELQADCLAGVWAHTTYERKLLDPGDVQEAIAAATAVGDDTIQRSTVGRVRPDTFTHGTSVQRVRWFRRGFDSGSSDDCDTFSLDSLD
jgi:predicted metalloprotease